MPAAVAVGVAPGLVFAVAVAVLVPLLHVVVDESIVGMKNLI